MAHPFAKRTETAPMICATWGEVLAPAVAALIVERPPLGRRLALAPRRVLHAVAAFVTHALEQGASTTDIARDMDTRDVRELLRRAIPTAHPRLYGLLDRLGDQVRPLHVYQRTNRILCGPAGDLLLNSEAIDDGCLQIVEELVADPVLLAAQQAVGRSEGYIRQLRSALIYLRATGLAREIEQLPTGAGWRSIQRRVTADLGRAVAPSSPFRLPAGWRQVETLSDLLRWGRRLQNCVARIGGGGEHHLTQFVSGADLFFAHDGGPLALASVHNVGPTLWIIADMTIERSDARTSLSRQTLYVALSEAMVEVGHTLLDVAPASALHSIGWRAERAIDLGDDDLDDAA